MSRSQETIAAAHEARYYEETACAAFVNVILKCPSASKFHRDAFESILNVFTHELDDDEYINDTQIDHTIKLAVEYKNAWALEAMFLHDTETAIEYTPQYAQYTEWFFKFLQQRPELLQKEDTYGRSIFYHLCISRASVFPKELLDYILYKHPEYLENACSYLSDAIAYKNNECVIYLLQRGMDYTYNNGLIFFDVRRSEIVFHLFDYGAGYLLTNTQKGKNVLERVYYSMISKKHGMKLIRVFYALGLRSNVVNLEEEDLPSEEECASTRYRAYFHISLSHRLLVRTNYNKNQRTPQKQIRK